MIVSRMLKVLQCVLLGHQDEPIMLTLGKIIPDIIDATRCDRCGRILIQQLGITAR
jgi:hypothetical protein